MIPKEKHFTKCETPNSSRIIEDKKHAARLTNGAADAAQDAKRAPAVVSPLPKPGDKPEESKSDEKSGKEGEKPKEGSCEDVSLSYSAPKYGTVIPNRIFVGGFSAKTTDEDLWRFFSSFSHITAAKIIYDRAGNSKCYGFVTFANPKDSKMIVKQSGGVMYSPMGRLRIAQAVRKQVPHYQSLPAEFSQLAPPEGGYYGPQQKAPVCMMPAQAPQPQPPQHLRPAQASPPSTASSEAGPHYPPELYVPTYMLPPSLPNLPSLPAYDATGLYTTCPGYATAVAHPYPYVVMPAPGPRDIAHLYPPQHLPYPPACYAHDLPGPKLPLLNSYIY